MSAFEYRTFLLPQLLIKLGVFASLESHDPGFDGVDFMAGETVAEDVNLLLSFIHPTSVLLNLAGYNVEAAALAATIDDSSAGLYVLFAEGEYCTSTAGVANQRDALQTLINEDMPEGYDLCLALRLTPRPTWWRAATPEEYYALSVSLDGVDVAANQLAGTQPQWLLLGANPSNFGDLVTISMILTRFNDIVDDLRSAIVEALADEWSTQSGDLRGGLLPQLNPDTWGDTVIGPDDNLKSHYQTIEDALRSVYNWLETLDKETFEAWLLQPHTGGFKRTLRLAQERLFGRKAVAEFESAVKAVFVGSHPSRDWVKFEHIWDVLALLYHQHEDVLYINVLMLLEELAVIDMLGQVRHTDPTVHETLPFDITGFYEQVWPPDILDDDTGTYDFHTLQINQAGIYAQGFWQERVPASCNDDVNGGRYVRFKHYRFCLDRLGNQTYDTGQTEIFMQVYRWENENFLPRKPYLELPDAANEETYCNQSSSEIGTIRISQIAPLDLDEQIPDEDLYFTDIPSHSVEIEIDIGSETILLRRVSPIPYLAQADLIEAPEQGREDLVLVQRFPLHGYDRLRIVAGARALIDGIQNESAIFASGNILNDLNAQRAVEVIDETFAEWMARYVCYNTSLHTVRTGPQIGQIRNVIVNMLAKEKVWDDKNLEVLTILTVFLASAYHQSFMPYTRAILGSALPDVTPEMEAAVQNSTAGLHVYRWGTNGLGEKGQSLAWSTLFKYGVKTFEVVRAFSEVLDDLDSLVPGLSFDFNLFLLEIEKLSPLTDVNNQPYPGWAPGEKHMYVGFQVGGGVGVTTGVFLNADSTQLMYSPVNWDPGDFSGRIVTVGASIGSVIDFNAYGIWRIDVNQWLENMLHESPFIEILGNLIGFDPDNVRLGFGLSMTIFEGNSVTWPMRSGPSFNWIDYSRGIAGILEANALSGYIIHVPEWLSGSQAVLPVPEWEAAPATAVEWRVTESSVSFETFNDIDEWELDDAMKADLRQMVAEYLACFHSRSTKLTIAGHASPVGTEAYNMWLSQKRAQAVYDYIRSLFPDNDDDANKYAILAHNTSIQGYGELYATHYAMHNPDALAPEWQTVKVYINGKLILRIGERIDG